MKLRLLLMALWLQACATAPTTTPEAATSAQPCDCGDRGWDQPPPAPAPLPEPTAQPGPGHPPSQEPSP